MSDQKQITVNKCIIIVINKNNYYKIKIKNQINIIKLKLKFRLTSVIKSWYLNNIKMFTTVLSLMQGTYSVHFEQKTWGLFLEIPDDLPDPMIIFLNVFLLITGMVLGNVFIQL